MNTKLLCFRTAVALTSLTSAVLLSSTAQAFTLTGENTLALSGRARFDLSTGVLDFRFDPGGTYNTPTGTASVTTSSSGRFESLINQFATLQDIRLNNTATNVWEYQLPPLDNFITVGSVAVRLSTFKLVREPGNNWIASMNGVFQDTDLPAIGEFDPLQDTNNGTAGFTNVAANSTGSSYAFDVEEVPTPALLPGLVGLGVAALRRKDEESAEENA
ncbi:PTPA-CTERM sorting domain-containing protein [Nodosilinea sp. LEGE 07298]|uniref:PTPA-CTERM sorting domain-containing protein n=1 Tax=Nodosilinea sp. LEGE 07298 TaxID=2777970 RepID=UPI00187FD106|nr:PTPA-CTERM sorting domain-containing protein [Nodosilinea sp. LEGE 07298]MBE9112160.1 PTPA-CTERM sorting domain-containing protein [Nodosilinea sp. LEGE 07298]